MISRAAFGVFAAVLIAVLQLGACASVPARQSAESITYDPEPPPWCGRCETRKVTVSADDTIEIEDGHWAGRYADWRVTRRSVQAELGTYARLKEALAPFRPSVERIPQSDGEFCAGEFWSDSGGVVLTWAGPEGAVRRWITYGCSTDRPMNDAVQAARAALPLPE